MNKQHFFSIGADPEIFLQDKKTDKYISAVGLIGGTKQKPLVIDHLGNALLEDNVSVEFNTAVAYNYASFEKQIKRNLKAIEQLFMCYKISNRSAISFTNDQLETPQANLFGCEPDYNAWTGKKNPKPFAKDPNLRSAGGHIHVGHDYVKANPQRFIQLCDLFLGLPSIFKDEDATRRELYGKAGAFRKKPFGVEYRSLSNFWIFSNENIEWVYTQLVKIFDFIDKERSISPDHFSLIQEAINESNKEKAAYVLTRYKQYV